MKLCHRHLGRLAVHGRCRGGPSRCASQQQAIFDQKVPEFKKELPDEVIQRLDMVVKSAIMDPKDRVLDVGTGTGRLIPHIQSQGVKDILAIDVAPNMLAEVEKSFPAPSSLGNAATVRTWLGPFEELPLHQGRADVIFMNAVFGNLKDQHAALLHSSLLLNPGGKVVISHPLGRRWHRELHESHPDMVPHVLPDLEALDEMLHDLPLAVRSFTDESEFYNVMMAIPPGYAIAGGPLRLRGPVVEGFGRGSKQMGIPTANLLPTAVEGMLRGHPTGVYFGWAQLQRSGEAQVVPMVMNYGQRPSIKDGSHNTVEVHMMETYPEDFHGFEVRAIVTGFIRPEIKFNSLDDLVNRIHRDISISKVQLQHECSMSWQNDDLFT